jgi:hypothetical protein
MKQYVLVALAVLVVAMAADAGDFNRAPRQRVFRQRQVFAAPVYAPQVFAAPVYAPAFAPVYGQFQAVPFYTPSLQLNFGFGRGFNRGFGRSRAFGY